MWEVLTTWILQQYKEFWVLLNRPLWGTKLWKDIWKICPKPDAAIQVLLVSAHSSFTLPGNHKASILAQAQALLLEEMLTTSDAAECVHCKLEY